MKGFILVFYLFITKGSVCVLVPDINEIIYEPLVSSDVLICSVNKPAERYSFVEVILLPVIVEIISTDTKDSFSILISIYALSFTGFG